MNARKTQMLRILLAAAALAAPRAVVAQDDRPAPAAPTRGGTPGGRAAAAVAGADGDRPAPAASRSVESSADNGRRTSEGERVKLAFKGDSTVEQTMPLIMQITGKTVMPAGQTATTAVLAKKITVMNDEYLDRNDALDILFAAFRMNGVGVIETDDRVILCMLNEAYIFQQQVIGPGEKLLDRNDKGIVVTKIFALEHNGAEPVAEQLREMIAEDTKMTVDPVSNQITVIADIGLCQYLQGIIDSLDKEWVVTKTQTFRLAHADAAEVAQNILELYEDAPGGTMQSGGATSASGQAAQARARMTPEQRRRAREAGVQPGATQGGTSPGAVLELRVTVNAAQNSLTVTAEEGVLANIERLIATEWDLKRSEATQKLYRLKYTDPLKMRDMLQALLGAEGTGGGGGGSRRRTAGGASTGGTAQAGRGDIADVVSGIYQIEAYPDSNVLVVICKTEQSFLFLDALIAEMDQPINPGLPEVISLKHADAEEVADQVNVILAMPGARVELMRRDRGLRGIEIAGPGGDEGGAGGGTTGGAGGEGGGVEAGGVMQFPWQAARPSEDEMLESALIGRVRVVPIHRQNAVMVLAAPEYSEAVRTFIEALDQPGRQVMIAAVIAEIELGDDLAFGVRFSSRGAIVEGAPDYQLGATADFAGEADDIFSSLFDTSTLSVGMDLNIVLQALAAKTKVRVLQEPRVFTADNQEASFFQGQDVPILTTTQTTDSGNVLESVNYEAVGVGLNVRPRITSTGDIDMEVNLVISNINRAAGTALNSPTFDRRETTTQIIVKDGQTIAISGILRDEESKIQRKVPLLGDIPIIGWAFKSVDNATTRTELIAFITPVVVDNPSDNDTNFQKDARERLENLTKPLSEQERTELDPEKVRQRLLYNQDDDIDQGETAAPPKTK